MLLANQFLQRRHQRRCACRSPATGATTASSPREGFIHFGSAEFGPGFLGGTFLFTRYTAYSRRYFPLPLGFVFKTNATIGYIQQLDPEQAAAHLRALLPGRHQHRARLLPAQHQPHASRCRARQPARTRTVTQFRVGGNKQLILNLELEFPIFEKVGIRGVLFYDAGNAYAANERFFQDKQDKVPLGLFHSVGFGFRWFSPVGPLRFEWGIPLTKRPEDEPHPVRVHHRQLLLILCSRRPAELRLHLPQGRRD